MSCIPLTHCKSDQEISSVRQQLKMIIMAWMAGGKHHPFCEVQMDTLADVWNHAHKTKYNYLDITIFSCSIIFFGLWSTVNYVTTACLIHTPIDLQLWHWRKAWKYACPIPFPLLQIPQIHPPAYNKPAVFHLLLISHCTRRRAVQFVKNVTISEWRKRSWKWACISRIFSSFSCSFLAGICKWCNIDEMKELDSKARSDRLRSLVKLWIVVKVRSLWSLSVRAWLFPHDLCRHMARSWYPPTQSEIQQLAC